MWGSTVWAIYRGSTVWAVALSIGGSREVNRMAISRAMLSSEAPTPTPSLYLPHAAMHMCTRAHACMNARVVSAVELGLVSVARNHVHGIARRQRRRSLLFKMVTEC